MPQPLAERRAVGDHVLVLAKHPPVQHGRVLGLHTKLREGNLVVEYDPAIPPEPGFAKYGGFALRPRTEADGNLMFRVNEHTTVTDFAREVWQLPPFG